MLGIPQPLSGTLTTADRGRALMPQQAWALPFMMMSENRVQGASVPFLGKGQGSIDC